MIANEPGTDNEGYGNLIYVDEDGVAVMGDNLPPIRFCPWCGAPKEAVKDE